MKRIIFILFLLVATSKLFAQSSIILPNGTVIPSFTQATRPVNPVKGQLIYQTDGSTGLYIWNGTAWTAVSSGGSGNSGTVTNVTANSPLSVTNGSTTPAITIQQANGTTNGFLSSTDWNTFNNKQNTLPNANTATSGILTSADWNTFNNKQNPLPNANATTSGILTSADWNTFNNKQNPLSNANATTSGILTSADWNTFNNKQNPLSNANATTSGILTSADWNTFNNKQNPLPDANATTSGILTSADWNTFNSKQSPLSNANSTTSGILTSADWNTFNNKQNPLSNANATTSGILTSADWNTFNNKQNPLPDANATTSGILTSADWNTFNNKQNPLSNANATASGILTSADWNTFNNKFTLPVLNSGSLLFSNGSTISQNNSKLFWDNTNFKLGVGTNILTFPLHVSSQLSPINNGNTSLWIVSSIGASTGSRLVMGTRNGNPTIGATNDLHAQWETLDLNPGGLIRIPYYPNAKILSTNSEGLLKSLNVENGIKIQNDTLQLGGVLKKNTIISLNSKEFTFQGGGVEPSVTVDSYSNSPTIITTQNSFGQSFVAQTTGILNKVSVNVGRPQYTGTGQYILNKGEGYYGGETLSIGNFSLPPYSPSTYAEINLNQPVVAGQVYTLTIGGYGGQMILALAPNNIAGKYYYDIATPENNYDLSLKLYETETPVDLLKIDGTTKAIAVKGSTNVQIESMAGTGIRNVVVAADGTLSSSSAALNSVTSVTATTPMQVTNSTTTPVISMSQANSTTNGYLSSTDWNTFNNKQNTLFNANATTSGILTSTDWNIFNTKQNALSNASASTNGILTSTDWNTFNNKYNLPSLTNGSILFSNGSNISQSNANLFWDNANKALGIGTTSPSAGLHIHGYGWDNGFRISSGSNVGPAVYLDGDTDFALISTGTGAGSGPNKFGVYDATANQYRMIIDNSGAMGVGTSNPATKLEVNGLAGLKVSSTHGATGLTDWISGNFGGQTGNRLVFGIFNQTATIGGHNSDLNEWRNLALNPNGANVGIGTDSPTANFDVVGTVRLRTGATENAVLVSDANGNASWNSKTPLRTASVAITVPPTVTLGGTTTHGMAEVEWVHNLGYQPIIMITNEQANEYSLMEYVRTSYYHVDNNTLKIRCTNAAGGIAQGTFRILIVN
ncbi:hypothetical protein GCM10011514_19270 [Emticicia aquatilis]|uniref:T9SS C-terminal target domain-containing protein n=1 Tax=Emticicia aquatilis TaxID=1537369 RepID=A0A916YPP9_9BACT|nr:hypothetical protein [Emticicia aquatilis]GGD55228.1 hypothetical protein GCM10011514_19270 [Emticicia aquatilis]